MAQGKSRMQQIFESAQRTQVIYKTYFGKDLTIAQSVEATVEDFPDEAKRLGIDDFAIDMFKTYDIEKLRGFERLFN